MEEEKSNLKEQVAQLNENFNRLLASGKVKGVKMPKTPSKGQVKKGYIYVIYINENGDIKPMKTMIEEGTTAIEGIPRIATPEFMLTYRGKPAIIQPANTTEPFSMNKNYSEAVRNEMTAHGHKLLLNRIERGELKNKKRISGAMAFGIVIVLIVVGYLLMRGF